MSGLIKKNRPAGEASAEVPPAGGEAAAARKSVIFRSRLDGEPAAEPVNFQEGLPPLPKAEGETRILNYGKQAPQTNLPSLRSTITIGGTPGATRPASEPANEAGAPAPPPVVQHVQQLVPDEIIQEAQQRAQQMMLEAQAAANQMLTEYQQQAQQMMEQANAQIQQHAENVQRQAQEIGFQQGFEQGVQQGGIAAQQQVYQQLIESRDIFIQAIRQRHLMLTSCEPQLARLSVKIAEKLVGEELKCNPETIIGIVRTALHGIGDRDEVAIRVNPADYDQVIAHRSDFEKMIEGLKKFEITADAAIDLGGAAIETNLGNIDARLNTRVAALTAGLEEAVLLQEKEIKEDVAALQVDVPEIPDPPSSDYGHNPEEPPHEAVEE
jgi:flagellar assembly protein FliH